MLVSWLGVMEACGLPPVKSAHESITVVGVAVTGIALEGEVQLPSNWLLPGGMQLPNVAVMGGMSYLAYQEVEIVSATVPTTIFRVLGAGIVPEIVIEIPLNAEASSRAQAFQYRPKPEYVPTVPEICQLLAVMLEVSGKVGCGTFAASG
jgi:hypothetical protein